MAWFSRKVSLGNFPDLAGAVNKLSESVKNIEKNFDTAFGFEDKSDSSTSTEASGLWPIMSLIGHVSEDSTVESSEKTVSPKKSSSVEEKESQNPDTEQTTALEEIQMLERKKDGEHQEIAEKIDDVISDSGKAELESNLQPEPKAAEPLEPVVHDVKIPDSVDELQGKEILKVGHAENPDTLEIKLEPPRVDEVEASSILHNKSHDVFHTESPDDQETQAEEIVEQSSIQAEASSDMQAEALDDVQAEASTDILAEASNDNRAVASSDTQAEAAVDCSSSQPISSEASERRCEELITQVPGSTRPLLRQIEAMQETTARRAEAWAAVERSLNSRLQEAETKAAVAEEREQSVNKRLSQTLSRINVLEAQISCLRSEQTQLSRSLEKERQREAENRQEYLAAKEEADTQECRANQLEAQICSLQIKSFSFVKFLVL